MNKRNRNIIIIILVIALIIYMIKQRSEIKKMTDPNEEAWDGTPSTCCYCQDGSGVCAEFDVATCEEVSPNHVDHKEWQTLNCNK